MKIELKEQTKENIKAYTISGIFIVITYFIFGIWVNVFILNGFFIFPNKYSFIWFNIPLLRSQPK